MMRGGLWLANPPARSSSLAAADGVFATVVDERGRTVGVRDARAPASAPLLYQRTDPAPASPLAAMFAGGGGAMKPVLFVGGVLLAAVVVRKLREAKRRG